MENTFYKKWSIISWVATFFFLNCLSAIIGGETYLYMATHGEAETWFTVLILLIPPGVVPFLIVRLSERGVVGSILLSLLGIILSVVAALLWFLVVAAVVLFIEYPIGGAVVLILVVIGLISSASAGAEVMDVFIFRRK